MMENVNRKVRLMIYMKTKDLNMPIVFYAETTWSVARAKIKEAETGDMTFVFLIQLKIIMIERKSHLI